MDAAWNWISGFFLGRWEWFTGVFSKPLAAITLLDIAGLALTLGLAYVVVFVIFDVAQDP